jgi:hypothetical protein
MKEMRSASQILFGFLPEQTVDLAGRVWKIREWRTPRRIQIDDTTLRKELLRLAAPWEARGTDNGYCRHIRQGREIEILSLDRRNGVSAESFPDMWLCKQCSRLHATMVDRCPCGSTRLGQLPFVGYHDCGALLTPSIRRCPEHRQVRVILPGTSSAAEISFVCPVCNRQLQEGFGFVGCGCGGGNLKFNVHRASPVFTPRTVVVVNARTPERARRLSDAGGPDRALAWVLDGLVERRFDDVGATRESLLQDLRGRGLPDEFVRRMVEQAEQEGALAPGGGNDAIPEARREEAARAAATLAMALDSSRTTVPDLAVGADGRSTDLANLYRLTYPSEIRRAGIEAVELVDRFPILTGNFAFTRGDTTPGISRLRPFMARNQRYVVYADLSETEALVVRLRPTLVAQWLVRSGYSLLNWTDERSARVAILSAIDVPPPGATTSGVVSVGEAVLRLVHSYAHRFIRRASVFAGIDRNALSELLVPHHLAFVVYAAARGDFVLGGLQAVFETELHHLLRDIVLGDHRCALDPGCKHSGGACMACLHIGEPSCRYFNQFLDRRTLFGDAGYLQLVASALNQ